MLVLTRLDCRLGAQEEDLLFLGPWCIPKKGETCMEHTCLPYHWDDREKLRREFYEIKKIYENVLEELVLILNCLHGVNNSKRFWRIFIGPWLHNYLCVLYDRYSTLSRISGDRSIAFARIVDPSQKRFVPSDFKEFSRCSGEDWWNLLTYSEILLSMGVAFELRKSDILTKKCGEAENQCEKISRSDKKGAGVLIRGGNPSIGDRLRRALASEQIFLYHTYLPRVARLRLELALRQIPRTYQKVEIAPPPADWDLRTWNLAKPVSTPFEKFVSSHVARSLPRCYLEGFGALNGLMKEQSWPTNPKTIFTSNAHVRDEFFKLWAATQLERGAELVIGQHGGGIGSVIFSENLEHEAAIADKYLTWGSAKSQATVNIPIGIIKKVRVRRLTSRIHGDRLTLVTYAKGRYSQALLSYPLGPQWEAYHANSRTFIGNLIPSIQKNSLVRLYGGNDVDQTERWKSDFPSISLSDPKSSFDKVVRKTRIMVCTYNGATLLESLAANIPTVVFWRPELFELTVAAEKEFARLEEANIFFKCPLGAASHVNAVWNDVNEWWQKDYVRDAVREFCQTYGQQNPGLIDALAQALRK